MSLLDTLASLFVKTPRGGYALPRRQGTSAMDTKEYPVTRTDAEWRKLLTAEQYAIMRQHGTEAPGSCALNFEKRAGTFTCAGCDQPLFVSHKKFESGTGWPSFNDPEPDAVEETRRPQLRHAAHGSALQPLRQPPGPRLPRRPPAHRSALLHQRRRHELQAGIKPVSSRALCPGSIYQLAPASVDHWIPATSAGMTREA